MIIPTYTIKLKWLKKICEKDFSNRKLDEYRDMKPMYDRAFEEGVPRRVRFRAGYRCDSPTIMCDVMPRVVMDGRRDWGWTPTDKPRWALRISNIHVLTMEELRRSCRHVKNGMSRGMLVESASSGNKTYCCGIRPVSDSGMLASSCIKCKLCIIHSDKEEDE